MSLGSAFSAALSNIAHGAAELVRTDSWVNLVTGFGTSRDKTEATHFYGRICALSDPQLAALYSYDDIAGRIADTYPREEMRLGFGLAGFDPDELGAATKYIARFEILQTFTDARIWGNVFGGSALWPFLDDGMAPEEPLDLTRIKTVQGLRVIDRRWLQPETWYSAGPKAGWPELFRVVQPNTNGSLVTIGLIHETRLILFPGARTEWLKKISLRMWDLSVLEKPYDAMRSVSNIWKAIETLVCDANQGVFKIKDLWQLVTTDPTQTDDAVTGSGPSGKLLKRIRFMDQTRSVGRAIVLDKEGEEFERTTTNFAGLSDLTERGWDRLSATSEIPVSLLMGRAPTGLNASGGTDMQQFLARVVANQVQIVEPRLRQLLKILFAARDAPPLTMKAESASKKANRALAPAPAKTDEGEATDIDPQASPIEDIEFIWLPLWAPTAAELSAIRLARAQEAQILITAQIALPEELAPTIAQEGGWKLDLAAREDILSENAEDLLKQRAEQKLNPPEPDTQPGAPGAEKPPVTGKDTTQK